MNGIYSYLSLAEKEVVDSTKIRIFRVRQHMCLVCNEVRLIFCNYISDHAQYCYQCCGFTVHCIKKEED